jgi:carbamoyl-phosphate synthase large subunit
VTSDLVIAFTCIGRRVQLVRHFRQACGRVGVHTRLIGLDTDPAMAAAGYFCDETFRVPHGSHPEFGPAVLDIIARRGVQMLIPLADPDLVAVGDLRDQVQATGCLPAYCGRQTTRISVDKLETYRFLGTNGLRTPRTRMLSDVLRTQDEGLPLFVKPRAGSAGKNALTIRKWTLPDWIVSQADQFICQEVLQGQEVTVDVFIDEKGQPHCAVPRIRLEVRGGEVMKSQVRMDSQVIEQACTIARALPDGFGVINIQGFILPDGNVSWTEINARFGGGSPLSIEAGACYPDLLVAMASGAKVSYPATIEDGMMMLRFDDAVYRSNSGEAHRGTDILVPSWYIPDRPVPLDSP